MSTVASKRIPENTNISGSLDDITRNVAQLQLSEQKHLSFPHNLLQEAEQNVVVDRALVRLVEHDDTVRRQ